VSLRSFAHTFVEAEDRLRQPILLLHRTGASETALIPWAKKQWPGAALLAPRGNVLENGRPRFFRRIGQAQFDLDDLRMQTIELRLFVEAARDAYSLDAPIAVGHSNGANIAWSLIFSQPNALIGAVLIRPLMPIDPGEVAESSGLPVLILSGSEDKIVSPEAALALPNRLRIAGAEVSQVFLRAGHDLVPEDGEIVRAWLSGNFG
jgi:phospholipase/carboxylesterase